MNICHILQSVNNMSAGPTYSVGSVAQELSWIDNNVHVCAFGENPVTWPFDVELVNFHNRLELIGLLSPQAINYIKELGNVSEIIHCHGVWRSANLFTLFLAKDHNSKIVWSPRGMFSEWSLKQRGNLKSIYWFFLQKQAVAHTDCFHATAMSEYEDIRKKGFGQPVALIPNGVPIPKLNGIKKEKNIVFLSRIHKKKGIDLLLEAWSELEGIYSDWRVKIAGPLNSQYADEIQLYAKKLNLKNVDFVGELLGDSKKEFLASASLFVLPSYSENFGIAIAESMAHATPVICTTETPWEGIKKHNCGWWVEPKALEIKGAIQSALNREIEELGEMGVNGRDWMIRDFSWGKIAKDMRALYLWLLGMCSKPSFVIVE